MTTYRAADLDGWEFKIVRSATATFRRPDRLREVLDEEARTGWELVEKFDDHRLRLKRRVEWRERDAASIGDPYRVWAGTTQGQLAVRILLGTFAILAVVLVLVAALR